MDDKFTIGYDMDDRWRVIDWRGQQPLETTEVFTKVEALTLMWAFEADPKRADQGYIEWRQLS